ncbi:MAG: DUF2304 domain-containing protein, partial [Tumebacillaceae bacterium]
MNTVLKLFLLACGIGFAFTVLYLLTKKKISEWNVIVWMSGAVAILIISARPEWVDWAAKQVGISYPPSLLFLFSTLVLLVVVLYQSMQISTLQSKVRQIAQAVAIQPHLEHPVPQ